MSDSSSIPPSDEKAPPESPSPVFPMFPLPNVVLIPGTILPLHVFEPRYRQMIEDLLDRSGRLVVANIREEAYDDIADSPPVHQMAGLGEIVRHLRFPDGRFLVWLVGLERVRVTEVDSDRLYRRVSIESVDEVGATEEEEPELRSLLSDAIRSRVKEASLPFDRLPIGALADILFQCLVVGGLPAERTQSLYEETAVACRARAVLGEHERHPPGENDRTISLSDSIPDELPDSFPDDPDLSDET